MVFDHAGKYLYITTSDGLVEKYNLSSGSFEPAYNVGGSLNGMDISADDSFLLLAQNDTGIAEGVVHKLDLTTGEVTNITYTLAFYETGAWDVAIASNNLAFVTTQFGGSGWTPLRQIDFTTNETSIRTDAPGSGFDGQVNQNTQIHRSADRTRLYFLEANISSGPVFTYDANTDTFGPSVDTDAFADYGDAGVNRDGKLLGTRLYSMGLSLDTAPSFGFVHSFGTIDGGIAFDPVQDVVYGVDSVTDEIIGYNTTSPFAEAFRTSIGEDVPEGRAESVTSMVASQDGLYLALATPTGIRLISTTISGTASLANISTRLSVQTGNNVLIGGFIITGTGPKNVIVRGIGPSLTAFGVPGALADPILEVHDAATILATNDDWGDTQESEIEATGLAPSDDRESAIFMSLDPGSYTAILSGANLSTGVGLVEVYDLDQSAGSKLANISTRGFVDTGDNVMIGGIIIGPDNTGDATVLLRAIGPSLANFGVADALQDPVLELHDGQGTILSSNDDWQDTQEAEIAATGLAPSGLSESAILQSLAPGNYTAIVSGKNATTGVALVEAYHLN